MTIIRKLFLLLCTLLLVFPLSVFSFSDQETVFLQRIHEGTLANPYTKLTEERLSELQPLLLKILTKEKELSSNYYQVITGQNSLFLGYQIFLKELNAITTGRSFVDYEFLRDEEIKYSHLGEFFDIYPDLLKLHERIKDWSGGKIVLTDFLKAHLHEINNALISASLTLETCSVAESAHHVFVTGFGMGGKKERETFIKQKMAEALEKRGIPASLYEYYVDQWIEMLPQSEEGILIQIFISKKFADQMMYVSFPLGMWLPETRNLKRFFTEFNQSRHSDNFDLYKPIQVRILADTLHPQRAKVFQYTTIDPEVIQNYRMYIRNCLEELFLSKTE